MTASPWAAARSTIAIAGLGFAAIALGNACLDYAGEDYGTCPSADAGAGSGDGTAAVPADCGAPSGADGGTVIGSGSGSGSATP
ncbi:MAG: hypothetical protein U0359_40895 [Byssovorax sp.]